MTNEEAINQAINQVQTQAEPSQKKKTKTQAKKKAANTTTRRPSQRIDLESMGLSSDLWDIAKTMKSTIRAREYIVISPQGIVIYQYDTPLADIVRKGLPALIFPK